MKTSTSRSAGNSSAPPPGQRDAVEGTERGVVAAKLQHAHEAVDAQQAEDQRIGIGERGQIERENGREVDQRQRSFCLARASAPGRAEAAGHGAGPGPGPGPDRVLERGDVHSNPLDARQPPLFGGAFRHGRHDHHADIEQNHGEDENVETGSQELACSPGSGSSYRFRRQREERHPSEVVERFDSRRAPAANLPHLYGTNCHNRPIFSTFSSLNQY